MHFLAVSDVYSLLLSGQMAYSSSIFALVLMERGNRDAVSSLGLLEVLDVRMVWVLVLDVDLDVVRDVVQQMVTVLRI